MPQDHPRSALIVAHGSPSDPDPQEAALQALAQAVAAHLPGWQVRGATLAAEGAFDAGVAALEAPLIYPFFMARGYFTGRVLAGKAEALAEAAFDGPVLPAFIDWPQTPQLIAESLRRAVPVAA